jgi:hypothetical protein
VLLPFPPLSPPNLCIQDLHLQQQLQLAHSFFMGPGCNQCEAVQLKIKLISPTGM